MRHKLNNRTGIDLTITADMLYPREPAVFAAGLAKASGVSIDVNIKTDKLNLSAAFPGVRTLVTPLNF